MAAAAAQTQTPAPQLAISGNSAQTFDLPRGWPLLVQVSVMHSQRFQLTPRPADLIVTPAAGNWYDDVTFSAPGWPLQLAQPPDNSTLVLPSRAIFHAVWQMSGDSTAALPLGRYSVAARLAVPDGSGWKGAVNSPPLVVNVIDEPAVLTDDQQSDKALLQARFAINQGDFNSAARIADALLAAQPSNWHALELRALLYEQAGDLPDALASASAAVGAAANAPVPAGDVFSGARTIQEPPEFLLRLCSRLRAALVAAMPAQ
jgi:hypothetical protein